MSAPTTSLVVAGRLHDAEFHAALALLRKVEIPSSYTVSEEVLATDVEWEDFLDSHRAEVGSARKSPLVIVNGSLLGDGEALARFARMTFRTHQKLPRPLLYRAKARAAVREYLSGLGRPLVYLDFTEEDGMNGRVVLALRDDIAPRAVANFRELLSSGKLIGSPIHRVSAGGWIQGGDIVDGSGAHSEAALPREGSKFVEDESFDLPHHTGTLSYANNGVHTNGSQYVLSVRPCPWLQGTRVAFGSVVFGLSFLRYLSNRPTENERPLATVTLAKGGDFDPIKDDTFGVSKAAAPAAEEADESESGAGEAGSGE